MSNELSAVSFKETRGPLAPGAAAATDSGAPQLREGAAAKLDPAERNYHQAAGKRAEVRDEILARIGPNGVESGRRLDTKPSESSPNTDPSFAANALASASDLGADNGAHRRVIRVIVDTRQSPQELRQREMQRDIDAHARVAANAQFTKDPGVHLDPDRVAHEQQKLIAKYPEHTEFIKERYRSTYDQQFADRCLNDLNWAQRAYYASRRGLDAAWDTVASKESWKIVAATASTVGSAAWEGAKNLHGQAVDKVAHWINNPGDAVSAVGSFAKGICDDVGLTNIAVGVKDVGIGVVNGVKQNIKTVADLGRDFAGVVRGEVTLQNLGENLVDNLAKSALIGWETLKGAGQVAWGAVKTVGELTGVTDLGKAVYYAARGEWGMAAMHGGFALLSAGSIVATVATGGLAAGSIAAVAAGKMTCKAAIKQVTTQALKQGAKEGCEVAGRQIGEKVVGEIAQKLTPEVLQTAGREIAEATTKSVDNLISKQGVAAATPEAVQQIAKDLSEQQTLKLLEKAGAKDLIDAHVTQLLKNCDKTTKSALTKQLMEAGVEEGSAKVMAKEMRKALARGASDKEMVSILTKEIGGSITNFMQKGMQESFSQNWDKGIKGIAKKHGLDEATEVSLKEAGEKGFKEGVQKAAHKVAREGVEQAFKRFRRTNRDSGSDSELDDSKRKGVGEDRRYEELSKEDYRRKREEVGIKHGGVIGRKKDDLISQADLDLGPQKKESKEQLDESTFNGITVPFGNIVGRIGSGQAQEIEKRRAA